MESFYIFYLITAIIFLSGNVYETQTCDTYDLLQYGRKVFCENENEEQISCYEERMNMTAHITCAKWYHPKGNKTSQIVYCVDAQTWSEPLLDCKPECEKYPADMKPFGPENTKSFKWYIELVQKTPTKARTYKGIILNEQHIYIDNEFCSNEGEHVEEQFVARIYNPGGDFKDHAIRFIYIENSSCIVYLGKNHIRFNNDHKPVCSDSVDFGFYFPHSYLAFETFAIKGCNISSYDSEKFEVRCFKKIDNGSGIEKVDCSQSNHDTILKRCQLGYESQKPLTVTKNFYISRCKIDFRGLMWNSEHVENDCVLTCGEVDKEYIPPATPLLFRGSHIQTISAPWNVGIYYKKGDKIDQICGGTIIHTNIIISAAHCFYDDSLNVVNSVSLYLVAAGKKYRSFGAVENHAVFANVKEIFHPRNYLVERQQNDLAILTLDRHFNYSPHIKPVCVDWKSYKKSDIPVGTNGRVVGWGATSSEDKSSPKLQTISLKTLTREQCQSRIDPNDKDQITGDKFCAVNENNATACRGDSGGGFVVKKKYGSIERYVLAGIVSLGVGGNKKYCTDGFLTLFTNIQLHKDLIQEYISEARNIEYFNSDLYEYSYSHPYLS